MNGISSLMSKSFCPIYKHGTNTINKINQIPPRSSNFHLQTPCPLLTTRRMLKHRVFSTSTTKNGTGSTSEEVPEISTVIPYLLIGLPIMSIALAKPEGFLKSKAPFYICLGFAVVSIATCFLSDIMHGLSVLQNKPFAIGDIMEVGSVKGQVIERGPLFTTLLTAENRRIQLLTSMFYNMNFIVEKYRDPWHAFESEIPVKIDEIKESYEITDEIREMMNLNSNVYLEEKQPSCYMSYWNINRGGVLTLSCNLKPMSEEELSSAKNDILLESLKIIEKHREVKKEFVKSRSTNANFI